MDELLREFAVRLDGATGVARAEVTAVFRELGRPDPPEDYLRFMEITNGGDGFLGERSLYLRLYPVEEIATHHRDYGFPEYAPHLVLFGCDGGGTSFSFAKEAGSRAVYAGEFTSLVDAARAAPSFVEFLGMAREGRWW